MGKDSDVALPETFDDLDIGITLRDPETGVLLDANDQVERLYGYSRETLLEMDIERYTPPSTKFSQNEAIQRIRAAAAGDPQVFEWRVERASGELIWIRVRLNATTIEGRTFVIAEIRDITEYKARERRLRLLNRVVRHNLRNETNVLVGYADRLKSAVEEKTLQAEIETILDIATEIGTLSDSIQQIEEIAKPNATERTPTKTGELVQEVAAEIQAEYPAAELTLDVRTEVTVNADRGLFHAIKHALDNAIVHNDNQTAAVEVVVTTNSSTGQAEIRVIDTGPAIPAVEINVLNDDVEASSTYHGSGLGLWVMQWCVDSHGGELVFDENTPRGNVVRFLLPRLRSDGS
ncbi:PAS domain-containing sensor histidine kinase [Natrinema salaciae]|uniref:histidine kinase n=1 Tax=Natrinema salaciae TaxID=1186196 RepID=A0A1H8ZTJ6_9EURY|nr:PAS domain-containing sensor histidine kinase [Natrinema salaciae]SEP67694.1 PAS domain S-box-containing protein [Natrinema salaciae]